jgi:hypothetical protein
MPLSYPIRPLYSFLQRPLSTLANRCVQSIATTIVMVAVLLSCAPPAHAQNSLGSIQGTVVDPRGLRVAGADVRVTNLDTGVAISTRTNGSGIYNVPSLLPGSNYSVNVSKTGFQTLDLTSVAVTSQGATTVDGTLVIGRANVSITVKAADQMLTPDSPAVTTTIGSDLVKDLPFPEQGTLEVALLTPGVRGSQQGGSGIASENPGTYTGNVEPGAEITINGATPGHSAMLVDGADVTQNGYARAGITVSSNMVGQVTVISNGVPAQYGRTMGGVIITSTQAGTNQYHGTLSWRHTDPFFEASQPAPGFVVPPDNHQNFFSAVIGGPVIIPKIYNGRQKTFFFFGYEPARLKQVLSQPYNVLLPDYPNAQTCIPTNYATGTQGTCGEVSGHFANNSAVAPVIGVAGFTASTCATESGTIGSALGSMQCQAHTALPTYNRPESIWYQSPNNAMGFPIGAQYSSNTLYQPIANDDLSALLPNNPFAAYVLGNYPNLQNPQNVHYRLPTGGYDSSGTNADVLRGVINHDNRYALRIDHNIGSNDRMYGRISRTPLTASRYAAFDAASPMAPYPSDVSLATNAIIDETHIFTPSLINEIKVGFLLNHQLRTPNPAAQSKDWGASFGLTSAGAGKGFPSVGLGSGIFGIGSSSYANNTDQTVQFQDDITIVHGRHVLRTGLDLRHLQSNQVSNAGYYGGNYSFGGSQTNGPVSSYSGTGGASFVLGLISTYAFQPAIVPAHYRWQYYATYVQDDYRIRSNLTLNLGLRYEIETPRKEINDLQGTFIPSTSGYLNGLGTQGAFCFSGACGLPHTLWPMNYSGVQPRIGIAWHPLQKLTVTSAYAILRVPLTGLGVTPIPNLSINSNQIGGLLGGTTPNEPVDYISNPVAGGAVTSLSQFQGSRGPYFTVPSGIAIPYVAQTKQVPYSQQWSLNFNYQIFRRTLIGFGYNGARGIHLFNNASGPQNFPNLNTVFTQIANGTCFTCTTPNPYGIQQNGAVVNESYAQSLLPYQSFFNQTTAGTSAEIGELNNRTGVNSYHAGFVSITHRLDRGLTMNFAFTWSKAIDDTGADSAASVSSGASSPLQNPFNRAGEKAVSDFDVPARVIAGYVYQLPFGKRQPWHLSTTSHHALLRLPAEIVNDVFGDFVTGGIFRAESGNPFQPSLGTSGNNASGTTGTANAPGYWFSKPTLAEPDGTNALPVGLRPRPSIVPGVPCINSYWYGSNNKLNTSYLNVYAFTVPGAVGAPQLGNAPRTMANCRSPRIITFDANLSKRIPLGHNERRYLQFTAVLINAPNHPQYSFTGTAQNSTQGNEGKMFSSYTTTGVLANGVYPCLANTNSNEPDGRATSYGQLPCGFTPGQYFGEPSSPANSRYVLLGLALNF